MRDFIRGFAVAFVSIGLLGAGASQYISITSFGRDLVDETSAANARTKLGLGTIATQTADDVEITGGNLNAVVIESSTITSLASDLAVTEGGTGASTASDARTNLTMADNTYTPTCTDTTNIQGTTEGQFNYIRVGSIVFVTGHVSVDPTSAGAATVFKIPLPIASNLSSADDLQGTASESVQYTGSTTGCKLVGDSTADAASVEWGLIVGTGARDVGVSFSYRIE